MTTNPLTGQQAPAGSGNAERLRRIGFLLVPEFSLIAFTSALEPLRMANRLVGRRLYEWQILSVGGGPVHASNGLIFTADLAAGDASHLDLVLVCAGERVTQHTDRALLAALRRIAQWAPRLGASPR
jgi:transcriptional regulator GlxA family with amidase domain